MSKEKNKLNKKVLVSILVVFFLFFGGFILMQEYKLNSGEEIYLKTVPVDPRDYLRGDYVILSYEIQSDDKVLNIINKYNLTNGDTLYFIIDKDEHNMGTLSDVSLDKPVDKLYIQGKVDTNSNTWTGTNIGIHKYFVPEGKGYQIERLRGDLDVLLSINSFGDAIIKDIYYNESKFEFE
jgi:uncharacterized membrane-anchored protein